MAGNNYNGLEIAVIGMSGQFPQSPDYRGYWKNLCEGKELITTYSDVELRARGLSEDELNDAAYVKAGAYVENKDLFDHVFFGYTPDEASFMDPQIRLFHQHCWKALEDAGYASLVEKKKIGLYAGASENNDWRLYVHGRSNEASVDAFYLNNISNPNFLCSLISYKLNLRGPSVYINTACSTSLVAINLACRGLLTKECELALAGGVSVGSSGRKGYRYQEGMIHSADGKCRAFDKEASGTVPGEGAAVLVMKRLADAIRDRDNIYAVIKSTAVNNDGQYKVGYTAPSVEGQADCIKVAHKLAGVVPGDITYIEAHGTATRLGDPIEIAALNSIFGSVAKDTCAIGSVKSNMGHLDAAAGVAGLMKAALSLKHKKIPASLHFNKANPEIEFEKGPFYVNTQLREWVHKTNGPLRAGVSSFGIGGTNAHAVLEEAPVNPQTDPEREYKLFLLSAKTENALSRYTDQLKDFLSSEESISLADAAYSLQVGRKHFLHRKAILFRDREELIRQLSERKHDAVASERSRPQVVFMFPGQGAQYAGMAKGLYDSEPLFRTEMDNGFKIIMELTGFDFREILFSEAGKQSSITDTKYAQPLIFIVEFALSRLLISYGISPQFMIGHSIGEYVAACISGVFGFEDALRLVVKRGQLMSSLPGGKMLSVSLSETEAGRYISDRISLAAVNSPSQLVFSGDADSIGQLEKKLGEQNIACVQLQTSHAFHSVMLDSIKEEFRAELMKIKFSKPRIAFVSNLTGDFISDEQACSPAYWVDHMRETVRFSGGLRKLLSQSRGIVFVEAGPGHALSVLLKQHIDKADRHVSVSLVRHSRDLVSDVKHFTAQIGLLWQYGIDPDWTLYYQNEKRNRVSLPTYSFEPVSFPAEVDPLAGHPVLSGANFRKKELKDWIYYPAWKRSVSEPGIPKLTGGKYLFFTPGNSFCSLLSSKLSEEGHDLAEVVAGEKFERISANRYAIDPLNPDDYNRLIAEIIKDDFQFTDIIYGWGMLVTNAGLELSLSGKDIHFGYISPVRIVQAMLDTGKLSKRFVVLTGMLHSIMGNEKTGYMQSLLLGLVNVLPLEQRIPCFNLDVDPADTGADAMKSVKWELEHNPGTDRIVAIRNALRWVMDYQVCKGEIISPAGSVTPGGVYLVTGGLGNVGFVLAEHLVKTYDARLILMGRMPAEEAERSTRLQSLRKYKTQVLYYSCDVSDSEKFKSAVLQAERETGSINGIVHAAGNVDLTQFELIEDIHAENVFSVFAPKTKGIENIHRLFSGRQMDFVWITSSLSNTLGGISYAAYAAANLYMDHFITSVSGSLPQWKCVALSEMLFSEDEIALENPASRKALKPYELCRLFDHTVSLDKVPVILASVEELSSRINRVFEAKQTGLGEKEAGYASVKNPRPELSTPYVPAATETQKKVLHMVETLFGGEGIGIEDDFFELGGDSLKAMVLLKRINKEFGISLSARDIFKNSNVSRLALEIENILWLRRDVSMDNEVLI